ncbi:MAG: silent information regulator protein Sir2 [Patescibacteria group bacterium]|nr:silent information regulator protein Sir2 [Patescibacteria group bacterium]
MKRTLLTLVLFAMTAPAFSQDNPGASAPTPKPKVEGWACQRDRVEERLGRDVVATPRKEGGVYVQWRLLKTDPAEMAFNVYRATDGGEPVKVNDAPVSATTDFVDAAAELDKEHAYFVRPVVGGQEGEPSHHARLLPKREGTPYMAIKLQDPKTTFQKVGIADLNGDGKYDFVIKTPNVNSDPWYRYWKPSEAKYKLEAYLSDGTFLWSKDLGWNIEAGIWYSPYLVYDFDGDGRAEVAVKSAPVDVDYRETEPGGDPGREYVAGRVLKGPEYVSILDGMTGEEKARVDWIPREGFGQNDGNYNFASRNQMGVAYLDGKTPCLLVARGTYTTLKLVAYQYHAGKLEELWSWSSEEETKGKYRGQGAHFMHSADIDGDGRDEVLLGSCVIDDNGQGLWTTGLGHPDHFYLSDIDPLRPGLEIYYGIESRQSRNGACLVDAKTGEVLWGLDIATHHVHGTGLVSDIDPSHVGQECYSGEHPEVPTKDARWLHSAQGKLIANETQWNKGLSPKAVYWNGTPRRTLLMGRRLFEYPDHTVATDIEGHQAAWADILGDWREEVITSVPGELRVYLTPIAARDRRVTLMQDPIYRIDVAHLAMGYAQVPMTSYYLGAVEETKKPE